MVITEQDLVVKTYEKPKVKKSVQGIQYFRGEIKKSQEKLFPYLRAASCITFDQSYYTRGFGQLAIQKNLEEKHGKLSDVYTMTSGSGFGAIQALWIALGGHTDELLYFWANDLKKAVKDSLVRKLPAFVFAMDTDRINPTRLKKPFGNLFGKAKVRDLKTNIFIPVMDISGRVEVFTKENFKSELISDIAFCSVPDPVFFKQKPYKNGMGVLNGDISKTNDVFIRKNNPNINITSVGAPVRYYDKGYSNINRELLSLKISDQKHQTDLWFADQMIGPRTRYECTPIDEVYQFSTNEKQIDKSLDSGDIEL